jgi:hypothetical protein
VWRSQLMHYRELLHNTQGYFVQVTLPLHSQESFLGEHHKVDHVTPAKYGGLLSKKRFLYCPAAGEPQAAKESLKLQPGLKLLIPRTIIRRFVLDELLEEASRRVVRVRRICWCSDPDNDSVNVAVRLMPAFGSCLRSFGSCPAELHNAS